jgi:hypothetical protein
MTAVIPAIDQDQDPDQSADAGNGSPQQRIEVIGALADSDRLGPRFGDQQASDVADDDHEDPKVEQWRANPQQPRLIKLR